MHGCTDSSGVKYEKFKKPSLHLLGFAKESIRIVQLSIYEKKACFL